MRITKSGDYWFGMQQGLRTPKCFSRKEAIALTFEILRKQGGFIIPKIVEGGGL